MRTIPAIIEHNASFQQGAPVSAVDLLSGYEPATEVPTILANCGQQRDVLRPLRGLAMQDRISPPIKKIAIRPEADMLACPIRRAEAQEGIMRFSHVIYLSLIASYTPAQSTALAQEIRISHQWAEHTDARDRAARIFAQEAEARAQGLKFRIYPNSSLNIKPDDLLDALQNDKLEMAVYPLVYGVPKVPEFSLAGLPGIVPNLAASH